MRKDDCFLLGYVIKPHGLKGEVSVLLDTDIPEAYTEMESVFLEIDQRLIPFFISALSLKENRAIVQFEGIKDFAGAEALKGCALYLPDEALPEMGDDQFYYHEIIGYKVVDGQSGIVGEVTNVYASGKQDLLAVDHQGTEILIPVIDEIISRVDREQKALHVDLPDGLLDIYLKP